MIRFGITPESWSSEIRLSGDDFHYLARVRRVMLSETILLFDGAGLIADAVVKAIHKDLLVLTVQTPRAAPSSGLPKISVLLPLIKGERMDWAIEKLVETGASHLVIWDAARAVVKVSGDRATHRVDRFRSIAKETVKQCGRPDIPTVQGIVALSDALATVQSCASKWFLWEDPKAPLARNQLPTQTPPAVALLSGPEGSFSPEEMTEIARANFLPLSLGPFVLRAETAPVVAVSQLVMRYSQLA